MPDPGHRELIIVEKSLLSFTPHRKASSDEAYFTFPFHLHLTRSFHVHVSLTRTDFASWDDKAHCVIPLASLSAAG